MNWLEKISQRGSLIEPSQPSVNIQDVVIQVANGTMNVEQAASELMGQPEACFLLNTAYNNMPNAQRALQQLAMQVGCELMPGTEEQEQAEQQEQIGQVQEVMQNV